MERFQQHRQDRQGSPESLSVRPSRNPLGRLAARLFNTSEISTDIMTDNYTHDEQDLIKRVMKHGTRGIAFVPSAEGTLPSDEMVQKFIKSN